MAREDFYDYDDEMRAEDRHARRKAVVAAVLIFILFLVSGGLFYLKQLQSSPKFFDKTSINGQSVAGKTREEVLSSIKKDFASSSVTVTEGGTAILSASLQDMGGSLDEEKLSRLIDMAYVAQRDGFKNLLEGLFAGNSFTIDIPLLFDEAKTRQAIEGSGILNGRTRSQDAYLTQNASTRLYEIVPEVRGNEVDPSRLAARAFAELSGRSSDALLGQNVAVALTDDLYLSPAVTQDDETLNYEKDLYNRYCLAEIHYTFGSETKTLGWDTIQGWLDTGSGTLLEEPIRNYIYEMAYTYNTRYTDRIFRTTNGYNVTIPANLNEYGYRVDQDGEYAELLQDIRNNQTVSREPVYFETNDYGNPVYYRRNGVDDLCGTYVEVSLSSQHLWFYKNGYLIVESDVVSGSVARNATTQTGAFPLAYKESPSVLVGDDAQDGYRTEVQFWMPFYEGQGLHDATWRGAFGGDIYVSGGSHGCVNLPYSAAEAIYNNIEAGVAIIIY